MATQLFNRLGQLGLGLAVASGLINTALYNGEFLPSWSKFIKFSSKALSNKRHDG